MNRKCCFVIVGPTAVGKTSIAIRLATELNTQIISADSRQCYRELNIGVAKPSPGQLEAVKHFFINSHSIHEQVNAATFEAYALGALDEIFANNDFAVVVGGTGLYIDAFCNGLDEIPAASPAIRNLIIENYHQHGLQWLQQEVKLHDPDYFRDGEVLNPQRLMRSLEVKMSTGVSIKTYHSGRVRERNFTIRKIGLELPRESLYGMINNRVDDMLANGLIEEAASLLPERHLNALNTVGYKEVFQYRDGIWTREECVAAIKQNTRRYAKRQLTWFKRDVITRWFLPSDYPIIREHVLDEIH